MVPSEPRGRLPFTVGGEETSANGRGAAYVGRFPELEGALAERVLELRRGRPLAPLTIVVGSSSVRTRVGDLLVRRLGAIANVCVVTLSRLAGDLVVAARGAPRPTLAGIARERLIRRLVASRELAYFAPVQDRPHFPRAVAATFADLREARVAPASDWARTAFRQGAAADTPSSEAKAADLQGLYAAYCDELARRPAERRSAPSPKLARRAPRAGPRTSRPPPGGSAAGPGRARSRPARATRRGAGSGARGQCPRASAEVPPEPRRRDRRPGG